MTLNEICSNIELLYSHGRIQDDYVPKRRQIAFMLRYYRALFLRRDLDKSSVFNNDSFIQNLGIFELENVDIAETDLFEQGCTILRSVKKIPRPVRLKNKNSLQVFGGDKKTPINPTKAEFAKYISDGYKFIHGELFYFWRNDRIYIPVKPINKILKYIDIQGIFEDPITAAHEGDHNIEDACLDWDSEYPISGDYVQQFTQAVLSGELKFQISTPEDNENDAR